METLWATIGTIFSPIPATIQKLSFIFSGRDPKIQKQDFVRKCKHLTEWLPNFW